MKKMLICSSLALIAVLAITLMITGCETGGDTAALTISPSSVDLSTEAAANSQTFSVTGGIRELSMPLSWSVSNPSLGTIGASGGTSASYLRVSGRHGDNSIRVEDQYGATGVATVHQ